MSHFKGAGRRKRDLNLFWPHLRTTLNDSGTYQGWKRRVRKRCDHRCKGCGIPYFIKGKPLTVHHHKPLRELITFFLEMLEVDPKDYPDGKLVEHCDKRVLDACKDFLRYIHSAEIDPTGSNGVLLCWKCHKAEHDQEQEEGLAA